MNDISWKIYRFRDDHGTGPHEFSLMLNHERMPICFDTFMDWVYAHIKPEERHCAWKLVSEEPCYKLVTKAP
jgi:hypothetical protein